MTMEHHYTLLHTTATNPSKYFGEFCYFLILANCQRRYQNICYSCLPLHKYSSTSVCSLCFEESMCFEKLFLLECQRVYFGKFEKYWKCDDYAKRPGGSLCRTEHQGLACDFQNGTLSTTFLSMTVVRIVNFIKIPNTLCIVQKRKPLALSTCPPYTS